MKEERAQRERGGGEMDEWDKEKRLRGQEIETERSL